VWPRGQHSQAEEHTSAERMLMLTLFLTLLLLFYRVGQTIASGDYPRSDQVLTVSYNVEPGS